MTKNMDENNGHERNCSHLLGVNIDIVSKQEILSWLEHAVDQRGRKILNNVNIHAMNIASQDVVFRQALNESDLVFVDGVGVSVGARLANIKVGHRVTPADMIEEIFELCARRDWSIFLLGDTEEVWQAFKTKVEMEHPACRLAGFHHGFFDHSGEGSKRVVEAINQTDASLLLVAMSMPIQEKWIKQWRDILDVPVCMSVGGLPRIYTGHIKRGPRWMTDNGLEWLYRLCVQRRLVWRRYLIGNPLFIFNVLKSRFIKAFD